MKLQTRGEQLLCVALTHLCSAVTEGTAPCLFYLQKLRVRGALLIWKQKRTKANKWRPNYLTLRSEFSPYWTSGTYLMSPGCCSLVSENKAKWLMLPCYCYIIYTSHLFLWLITGLVKYIGNVKRCRVRRDSVSVNLCRMSVGDPEGNLCKEQISFQGWSLEFTPLCAASPSAGTQVGQSLF